MSSESNGTSEEARKRFVVLDRDGTIIVERYYLSDPDDVELLPGAASGLRQLRKMGLGLVVVTNQSGIGRGFFDQARLGMIHQRFSQLLDSEGVGLDGIYFCPHVPEDKCSCRKPCTGLLEAASREHGFDATSCFVIGDKASDVKLGQLAGATTFLVSTGYGAQVTRDGEANPDYSVAGLPDAAEIIQSLLPSMSGV
jgi:D-glycero-D-manno-heptose 1,7-bisphosphate phosphatase